MSDVLSDIRAVMLPVLPPVVRVTDTGDPTKAYAWTPPGERRVVLMHPELAARLGLKDGDPLPTPDREETR